MTVESLHHLDSRSSKAAHGKLLSDIHDLLAELSPSINAFVRERAFCRFPQETQALFKVVGVADMVAWR